MGHACCSKDVDTRSIGFGQSLGGSSKIGCNFMWSSNHVPWCTLPTILVIEFLFITFVEPNAHWRKTLRRKNIPVELLILWGHYKDPAKFHEYKINELKNSYLGLLAFVRFVVQLSAYPGTGPRRNWLLTWLNPWHNNIGKVIIPKSILP